MLNKPKSLNRVCELNLFLLRNTTPIFRLRKIGLSHKDGKAVYAYAVSLCKNCEYTLEEMIWIFYSACKRMINNQETLTTEGKVFKISGSDFEVSYCVEAWRKSADKIGYIENGQVQIKLLHRMSCEQAAYIFKKLSVEPFELLNTLETLQEYTNPADKYCALAKMPILLCAIDEEKK